MQVRAKLPDGTVREFATREEAIAEADRQLAQQGSASKPPVNVDAKGRDIGASVMDWVGKKYADLVSTPLDAMGNSIRQESESRGGADKILGKLVAGAIDIPAHPKDNAPIIGGIAGDLAMAGLTRGASIPAALAKRGLAAGAGQALGGLAKDGDASHAVSNFAFGAAPAVAGGGLAALGKLGSLAGRSLGFRALNPAETDLAKIFQAETGAMSGYTPGRAEKIVKGKMFDKGSGRLGGDRYFSDIEAATDANETVNQGIIGQTRVGNMLAPWQTRESTDQNWIRQMMAKPRPEFTVDLADATKGLEGLKARIAGPSGGITSKADASAIDEVGRSFLDRVPDKRPLALPESRALPEGKVNVPLTEAEPSPSLGLTQRADTYENRIAPRSAATTGDFTGKWEFVGPSTVEGVNAPSLGTTQISLAPSSSLKGPQAFTTEGNAMQGPSRTAVSDATVPVDADIARAVGVTAATNPQGSISMPASEAARIRDVLLAEMATLANKGGDPARLAAAQEMVVRLTRALPPSMPTPTRVGFDTAIATLGNIDDSLMRQFQATPNAAAKMQDYVPSPGERGAMDIRGELRNLLNSIAPMGEKANGTPVSMLDNLDEYKKNIAWRNMAGAATGSADSGIRTTTGVNRTGAPYARLLGDVNRAAGVLARPLFRGGEALTNRSGDAQMIARILADIASREGKR